MDDALKQGLLFKGELPLAPQFSLYHAVTVRSGHPTGVLDYIEIHLFPESAIANEKAYVRFDGGVWKEFLKAAYDSNSEVNVRSSQYMGETMSVQGNNLSISVLDKPESRIEVMFTFDWNGRTYRSITAKFQSPNTFWQRYSLNMPGLSFGPSGGKGGESPDKVWITLSAGNMPQDLMDWTWYRSDKLEGSYEVMEGVKGFAYGPDREMFPVKQGDFFYVKLVPKVETGVTGWGILGPFEYK